MYVIMQIYRKKILRSELCSIRWYFAFRHTPTEGGWTVEFREDFTMISDLHGYVMTWQVCMYVWLCVSVSVYILIRYTPIVYVCIHQLCAAFMNAAFKKFHVHM